MSSRRIELDELKKEDGKVVGAANGLAGEDFDTEIYQIYGLSVNPKGKNESVLIEINGDPDNFVALPPGGHKDTEVGTTTLYYGDTEIILSENTIKINVDGNFLNIENGVLKTDLDIETSGGITAQKDISTNAGVKAKEDITTDADVKAGSISLKTHTHSYSWGHYPGASNTGTPS